MRRLMATVAMTCLFLAAPLAAAEKPANNDKNKLQGTWSLVSVEIDKNALSMDDLKNAKLVVKREHYSFTLGETRLEITFKMDAGKNPKTIDLTVVEGPEKGKVYRGIYKLEGDIYTICRTNEPDKDRPTKFGTEPGSGLIMVVWKRAKP
jgi:uncharacterized protein (TIGR03067 family)